MTRTLASFESSIFVNIYITHWVMRLRYVPRPPQSKHKLWVTGEKSGKFRVVLFVGAFPPQNVIEVTDGQSLSTPMISAIASCDCDGQPGDASDDTSCHFWKMLVFYLKGGLGCQCSTLGKF